MFSKNLFDFSSREILKSRENFSTKFHFMFCCLPTSLIEPLTPLFRFFLRHSTSSVLGRREESFEKSKSNLYKEEKRGAKYSMHLYGSKH